MIDSQQRAQSSGERLRSGLAVLAQASHERREKRLPDLRQPAELDPPDHAAYEPPRSKSRIVVELDHAAEAWFDQLGDSLACIMGTAQVRAWLSPPSAQSPPDREIAVHIGQRRVGRIPADHVDQYETVIHTAARRGELPVVDANLTKRETPPRYILEIPAIS